MSQVGPSGLQGRVGVVTGAYGHLGTAMSRELARAGAHVLMAGRNPEKLEQACQRVRDSGGRADALTFDLLDRPATTDALAGIEARFGRLDFLVNNAYAGRTATLDAATGVDFEETYRIGVVRAFELTQAALPLMRAAVKITGGTASIVNIASMYGVVSPDPRLYGDSGQNSPPFYGAAKAALLQLTRYLACTLGPESIRANAVSPGPFPATGVQGSNSDFVKRLSERVPMARIGRPDELASVVGFLASEASSYVTGASIPVDGGWTAW
jgi:NAD(P)-dependent dehydrogenase (short-subunit alcohol dehydrogenase family)